jgi:ABC-type glycerol-3-phosphate transport system substrate-binding protein
MHAGDTLVVSNEQGLYATIAALPEGSAEAPAQSALRFYTEFGNPGKTVYSWNRSLPEAQDAFVAGDVAVYFGFASEYELLRARNPNLQVGVERMPQIQGSTPALTFGRLLGVAVARTAGNPEGAAAVAQRLSAPEFAGGLAQARALPPVRRDLSDDTSGSAVAAVFAQSALIARGWLDPNPGETDALFQGMVESVSSGRSTPAEAVADASRLLDQLVRSLR